MRLFGDFLPFVGARVIDRAGVAVRGIADLVPHSPNGQWTVIEFEWLGHGFVLLAKANDPAEN